MAAESARVLVRVRPFNTREGGTARCLRCEGDSGVAFSGGEAPGGAGFAFDRVFGEAATQADVFDELRGTVQAVLQGFNASILAYGQTGSGEGGGRGGPAGRAGVACGRTPPRSARACRQDPHAAGRHLRPPAARHCAARGGRAGARHCCLPRALPVQGARGVGRGGALPRCRVRRPALSPHAGHAVSGGDLPRAHQGPAAPRE